VPAAATEAAKTTHVPSAQRDMAPSLVSDAAIVTPRGVDDTSVPVAAFSSSRNSGAACAHALEPDEGHAAPSPTRSSSRLDGEKANAPDTALQVVVSAEAAERSGHADGADEPAGQ